MTTPATVSTFGDAIRHFGTPEAQDPVIGLARKRHADPSDNEIEVDSTAVVSYGADGAWVSGWLFVPNDVLRQNGIVNPEDNEATTGDAA